MHKNRYPKYTKYSERHTNHITYSKLNIQSQIKNKPYRLACPSLAPLPPSTIHHPLQSLDNDMFQILQY